MLKHRESKHRVLWNTHHRQNCHTAKPQTLARELTLGKQGPRIENMGTWERDWHTPGNTLATNKSFHESKFIYPLQPCTTCIYTTTVFQHGYCVNVQCLPARMKVFLPVKTLLALLRLLAEQHVYNEHSFPLGQALSNYTPISNLRYC